MPLRGKRPWRPVTWQEQPAAPRGLLSPPNALAVTAPSPAGARYFRQPQATCTGYAGRNLEPGLPPAADDGARFDCPGPSLVPTTARDPRGWVPQDLFE